MNLHPLKVLMREVAASDSTSAVATFVFVAILIVCYAARITLINSVLSSLHTYWAMIILLPQKILRDIEKVCRAYLWSGTVENCGSAAVKWEDVCKNKHCGGLELRNVAWNCKLLWNIASKKDTLWLRWVSHFYMKGVPWKDYICPQRASWSWRAICKMRQFFMSGYDGDKWTPSADGMYSVSNGYKWLKGTSSRRHWWKWVWCKLNIPKHSVISWLFVQNRLKTRDRLLRMGMQIESTCPVCQAADESISHVFAQCVLAKQCLANWKRWIGLSFQTCDIASLMKKSCPQNMRLSCVNKLL